MKVATPPKDITPSAARRRRRLSNFHIHGQTPQNVTPGPRRNSWTPARHLSRTPTKTPRITPSRTPGKTPTSYRRRSSIAQRISSHTPRASVGRARAPALSREEIAHMYSATIKLCQDNKINARNTWTLNLIDYMSMLVKTDTAENQVARTVCFEDEIGPPGNLPTGTNFQLAGVTLDAGVKIYCSRVDSVHTNAFKVLGGLSRSGNQEGSDASEEAREGEQEGDTRKSRRNGRRAGNVTLETNLGNITSQRLETDLAVDPLFQKMSAAFDEGGASGMLMNNLPIGPKAQIIFDSGETADYLVLMDDEEQQNEGGSSSNITYDISKWLPEQPVTEHDTICGPFLRYFESKQASAAARNQSAGAKSGSHDAAGANNDDSDLLEHNFGYDDGDMEDSAAIGMLPTPEMPFDVPEGNDHDDVTLSVNVDHNQRPLEGGSMAVRRGSVDLVEAGVTLVENPDYSYFDNNALVGWAGPTHWTFRATSTSTAGGENGQKRPKKRTRKPRDANAMLLDFSLDAPEIDFASQFAPASRESLIQMSASVRNGFSEKKVTLPEDHHLSIEALCSLFLRPNTYVKPNGSLASKVGKESDVSEGQNWYDFDNPGDRENFVGGDPNVLEDFSQDPFEDSFEPDDDVGMELLAEPTRVEKIDINYAKVAKKVDVRKLKAGIWTKLCGDQIDEDLGPDAENGENYSLTSGTASDSLPDVRKGASQRLQTIVSNIPSIVPPTSLPDVSLPYVFICLLHLANEKQLRITQTEDKSLTDLIVTADGQGEKEVDS
ncbi:Condensin complex subunit 2 [Gracilaria domingensis]|nr:Condensin complex subunit 2 [Gracilaria domingensis]